MQKSINKYSYSSHCTITNCKQNSDRLLLIQKRTNGNDVLVDEKI